MSTDFRFNYYEVLEIPHTATQHEIAVAYEKAKKTYSLQNTDLNKIFSTEEARALRSMIDEAYSVLANQSYRSLYEKRLQVRSTIDSDLKLETLKKDSEKSVTENTIKEMLQEIDSTQQSALKSASNGALHSPLTSLPALPILPQAPVYESNLDMEQKILARTNWNGDHLKEVRTYKNMSYEHLTELTKINAWYLAAIENMEPFNLPAKVYVRGYVVQMAKALGLNDKIVADSYMKLFNQKIEQPKIK